jgi:hypothetical protein
MSGAIPPLLQYAFMAWCPVKKVQGQPQIFSSGNHRLRLHSVVWHTKILPSPLTTLPLPLKDELNDCGAIADYACSVGLQNSDNSCSHWNYP